MEDKTYNGWRGGYETWVTALWLDNDSQSSTYWHEQARECWADSPDSRQVREWKFSRRDAAALDLAERLKEALNHSSPALGACVYSDLLNAALSEIDWRETAEHYLATVIDEEADALKKEKRHG